MYLSLMNAGALQPLQEKKWQVGTKRKFVQHFSQRYSNLDLLFMCSEAPKDLQKIIKCNFSTTKYSFNSHINSFNITGKNKSMVRLRYPII